MTTLDDIQTLAPVAGSLPGQPVPYTLAFGEGLRREIDGQLWTVIARGQDTGGLFDAAWILGPRGAVTGFHSLPEQHRSYFVAEGAVQVSLPGSTRVLTTGDSVHVPAGVPVSWRMQAHLSRMLVCSAPSGAVSALVAGEYESAPSGMYSAVPGEGLAGEPGAFPGADHHPEMSAAPVDASPALALPDGVSPYFLDRRGGEIYGWPEASNAFHTRGRNTAGRYFAVDTLAAPQPYIIRHFHRLHTENFICLSGRVRIWANGTETLLTPGDFFHAPAGTIHSFRIEAHATSMLGVLTSDVFEPFFEATGVPTQDTVYTEGLVDPGVVPAGIAEHPELDLVVVGPPPED